MLLFTPYINSRITNCDKNLISYCFRINTYDKIEQQIRNEWKEYRTRDEVILRIYIMNSGINNGGNHETDTIESYG